MFKGMKDMGQLLKQAKDMKAKMQALQQDLKNMIFAAQSKNGKVKIKVNGEMEVIELDIDADVIKPENKQKLEKAISDAANNALKQAKDSAASKLTDVTGNLQIPGLND